MKLYYQNRLNPLAKKLRKAGNLSEVLLWNELKSKKSGYRFLRQRPIGKYIVDFYCHALNLVIEIDGHASHDSNLKKDAIRQKELESLGVRFIRIIDSDIRLNIDGAINAIREKILRLVNEPPPLKKEE